MSKQIAVEKKRAEVLKELLEWFKTCGIFEPGDTLEVNMVLISAPPVRFSSPAQYDFQMRSKGQTWQDPYKWIDADITEDDWGKIFSLNLSNTQKKVLNLIRHNGNKPTSDFQFKRELDVPLRSGRKGGINLLFKNAGLPFRIRHIGYDVTNQYFWVYQLWKAEKRYSKTSLLS